MKTKAFALSVLLLTLAPLSLFAQLTEAESFRGDMLVYVAGLSRLSPEVLQRYGASPDALSRAAESIRNLPAEELLAMKAQMDRVPFWRDVPAIVAYTAARPNGVPSPRELARGLTMPAARITPDMLRKPLLAFVDAFKGIPAEQVHPDYQERVARVEKMINEATPDQLMLIHQEMQENLPRWQSEITAATEGRARIGGLRPELASPSGCASSFAGVICEINHIIGHVVSFFQDLPTYATNAFNSIKNIFSDIFGNFPTTVQGALNSAVSLLGLNNVNWDQVAQTAQQYIRLPCPPAGMNLIGFGEVGKVRTWTNFSGTIGFAGNTLADVMPSDVLTSVDVQALVLVLNFPVQWLSHCLEKAWNDQYDSDQKTHRDLVTANLDVTVGSRATQDSVNIAQGWTTDIDGDVVKVEAKLDRLGVVTDRIEDTTERIIATTDRTEVVADRLETTSVRLDTTASRLESKVDNLQLQQGQTSDSLDALKAAYLRMLIEHDLFRQANVRISLFQLPDKVGGYLELVRSLVEETLSRRSAAGVDVRQAMKELSDGIREYGFGNFKSAYSHYRTAYQRAVN